MSCYDLNTTASEEKKSEASFVPGPTAGSQHGQPIETIYAVQQRSFDTQELNTITCIAEHIGHPAGRVRYVTQRDHVSVKVVAGRVKVFERSEISSIRAACNLIAQRRGRK